MSQNERRRVLVAAADNQASQFRELFRRVPLEPWDLLEADTFSRARFVLQHNPCDVLVVHDDLYEREGGQGLAWLSWRREVPVVLLVGPHPERYARAYELGVTLCLPRDMALEHPTMLAAGLVQAMSIGEMRFGYQHVQEQLAQSRRHMDRLVNMLWRSVPRADDQQWFPQRYILERLSEELARTERHGLPLTIAIGQLGKAADEESAERSDSAMDLPDWAAETIVRVKRRCDLAGQYGVQSFLLLLVQTKQEGGMTCCRRMQKMLEQTSHALQGPHRPLETFFGLATVSQHRKTPQALLRCAEERLQVARASAEERIAAE